MPKVPVKGARTVVRLRRASTTAICAVRDNVFAVSVSSWSRATLFNILSILGITALITPLNVAPQIIAMDIPISLAIVALTGGAIMVLSRLPRFLGGVMLAAYGGYLIWLFTTGSIAG